MAKHDDERGQHAREILGRVDNDSAGLITGSLASMRAKVADRASSHFGARDAAQEDRATRWATRIGRVLGLVFFLVLVINLFTGWFF